MASVYLETSFFSACVSTRTTPKSLGWRASSLEWWETQRSRHELFISSEVIRELSAEAFPQRDQALAMLRGLELLDTTPEILDLASVLVKELVMPEPADSSDAMHVAAAAANRIEYIMTWNVLHLANPKKRTHLSVICFRLGLAAPLIVTPDMLKGA